MTVARGSLAAAALHFGGDDPDSLPALYPPHVPFRVTNRYTWTNWPDTTTCTFRICVLLVLLALLGLLDQLGWLDLLVTTLASPYLSC